MLEIRLKPSEAVLILVNLIPIAGIVFLGWKVFDLFFLYWFESAMLGFFGIMKMIVGGIHQSGNSKYGLFFTVPFFLIHYSGFMLGHLIFIVIIFNGQGPYLSLSYSEVGIILKQTFTTTSVALGSMFVSHTFSFINNFLKNKEYLASPLNKRMPMPYGRIIVMHVSIFLAFFATMFIKIPTLAPLLIIGAKIVTDLRGHRREHSIQLN